MSLGLLHIYTGNGKGKTTAAIGLGVRAAGRGIPVIFLQLMKGRPTGELAVLSRLPEVTVLRGKTGEKFVSAMTGEERRETRRGQDEAFRAAVRLAEEAGRGLLIIDEVMSALRHGLLDEALLRGFLDCRPPEVEVVLTGRDAPGWLLERADYVTEMKKLHHPYDRGVLAREGIEE